MRTCQDPQKKTEKCWPPEGRPPDSQLSNRNLLCCKQDVCFQLGSFYLITSVLLMFQSSTDPARNCDRGTVGSGVGESKQVTYGGVKSKHLTEFDALKTALLFMYEAHGKIRPEHPEQTMSQ